MSGLTIASTYYLIDATSTLDQQQTDGTTGNVSIQSTYKWQSFTTGSSTYQISSVGFLVQNTSGSDGNTDAHVKFKIYEGQGTGGDELGNGQTQNISLIVGAEGWVETNDASLNIPVQPNTEYTISATSEGYTLGWKYKSGNPYANGRAQDNSDWDHAFKTRYSTDRGEIGTSQGSTTKKVGMAISTTELTLKDTI